MMKLDFLAVIMALAPAAFAEQPDGTSAAGVGPSDAEIREKVNAYLGAIDRPVLPDQWRALGPRAIPVLESIVKNGKELPTRRAKAIGGLVAMSGRDTARVFADVAAREEEPIVTRLAAVRGLAHVTPAPRVAVALRPLLEEAKDSRVRAVAAEQLVERTNGKSCDLVRAQAARESADARAHFVKALARCEHAG